MPAETSQREIFIADDDVAVREAIALTFSARGFQVTAFAEGESLLAAAHARPPACILLDVHMPGRSGLDILKQLAAARFPAPILVISGHGDIPMAVEAIKHGALDFIEKPFDPDAVVTRVAEAIRVAGGRDGRERPLLPVRFPGRERLTPREREVLAQVAAGASSKEAARQLGISFRTVEVHRAHIMDKLSAKNTADLVRIVLTAKVGP
ncbi:MAG TPA: response regulator [Xanthobacteraceae bacterium]